MSDQAQASTTTRAAKAPSTKRSRPSRARVATKAGHASGGVQPKPETAGCATGADLDTAALKADAVGTGGRPAATDQRAEAEALVGDSARLQEEADARLATEREAEAREAAEQEAARVMDLLATHQAYMNAASAGLNNASAGIAEISAILTWEPTRLAEVDAAASKAARGLADFRTYLSGAAGLDVEPYLRAPGADLNGCFNLALDAMRELHRRVGAQIALMEVDVGNVPALVAIERAIMEQAVLTTAMNRGLGRLLVQDGIAR